MKYFIIILLYFIFLNADCNNGYRKTQRERCINGVQGFQAKRGNKEEMYRSCLMAISATSNGQKSLTENEINSSILLCMISIKNLVECNKKSNIYGINK